MAISRPTTPHAIDRRDRSKADMHRQEAAAECDAPDPTATCEALDCCCANKPLNPISLCADSCFDEIGL
jgi:hypothetical protein